MSDFMREEFEIAFVARCKKKGEVARLDRFDDGRYEYLDASAAWWAWQASRECLVIDMPERGPSFTVAGVTCFSLKNEGRNEAIKEIEMSIHAAGVKTK